MEVMRGMQNYENLTLVVSNLFGKKDSNPKASTASTADEALAGLSKVFGGGLLDGG